MITKTTYIQKRTLGRLNAVLAALGYVPASANYASNIMNEYSAHISQRDFERIFWIIQHYGVEEIRSFKLTDRIFAASACYEHPEIRWSVLDIGK